MPGPRVWGKYLCRSPHSTGCPGAMWWLLLWGVLQACPTRGSVLLAQELPQQLTSPGYPEPYRKGQESSTDIKAPEGFAVRLIFQDFDLEPSQDCAGDSVTISASGSDPSQFCGQQDSPLGRPPGQRAFVSSGRSLRLTFRTQPSSENKTVHLHKGFLALYQTVVCGRPVTPIAQNQTTLRSSRAKLGNFPWQAFTSIHGRGGGALLGDRWILTAAHTIYPKDSVSLRKNQSVNVFLGHTAIDEMLKLGNHPVHRVIVHPDYRQNESHNFSGDIALLELQHSIPLGPNVLPVCLPDNETLYRSGLLGYVSGFGVEMGWLTTELKYSRLPVAPREACEAWLQKRQRPEVFSDDMFCVGDETQRHSVCQGDSGSVYVVWDDRAHHWVATGIVSWGIGCGEGYDFYTKVLSYVDWIKGVMNSKN
uniref:Complement C1r subcomponent-like protein n=1 Tax=Rhinopithecus bieti TaxID=61621 RepID=A0A2K6JZ34_RHIBE